MGYSLNNQKFLSKAEYEYLAKSLSKNLQEDSRNCLVLWTLLKTGARASEVLALTKDSLIASQRSVAIVGLKNSNDRELPLPKWLWDGLNAIVPDDQTGKLFPISYTRLHQVWKLYRPVAKKLHSTRHTFAMMAYEKTKDIRFVQWCLGHRSIANTMIYADYAYTQSQARKLLL